MEDIKGQGVIPLRLVLPLGAAILCSAIGAGLTQAYFVVYLADLGATMTAFGAVSALTLSVGVAAPLLAGVLVDRFRRWPIIAACFALEALGALVCCLVGVWQWLVVSYAMFVVAPSVVWVANNALVSEHCSPRRRGQVFGWLMGVRQAGQVCGPLLAGAAVASLPVRALFAWRVALATLALLITAFFVRDRRRAEAGPAPGPMPGAILRAYRVRSLAPPLKWLLLAEMVVAFGNNLIVPFIPVYLLDVQNLPQSQVGFLYSMVSAVMLGAIPLVGLLADRVGRIPVLVVNGALSALCHFLLMWPAGALYTYVVFALYGVMVAAGMPSFEALLGDIVRPEERGRVRALFLSAPSLAGLPGPAVGGWLIDHTGYIPVLGLVVACSLAYSALLVPVGRLLRSSAKKEGQRHAVDVG